MASPGAVTAVYFSSIDGADHGLGKMIEAGVLGKEAVEHRAQEEDAGAFERLLVKGEGDLEPASGAGAICLSQASNSGPALDCDDATDSSFRSRI